MASLNKTARIAGLLYIFSSLFGIVRLVYLPGALIVPGSAAATAYNIATHEFFFRFGILSYLLCNALWIFVTWALYRLLKGVDHALAGLMLILGLMVAPISFVNSANDIAALLFARGADFLSVFDKTQREALVMLFLNLHHQLDLAWELLGVWFIPFGLLVYRSRFLPRILGVWLIAACFAYLSLSFTGFLFSAYEALLSKFAQPVLFAEVAIMLWLAIMGVKEQPPAAV